MSAEFPRSGIVFYPVGSELAHMSMPSDGPGGEEGFQIAMNQVHPDVQPNLARQLGAATNAYCDHENIRLGTVIAVPYSASIAHQINALRHFDETGFLRVGSDATPILGQERTLLDELIGNAYRHLQELDLAKDGLFAAMRGRRIDIVAPSAIGRCDGLAAATSKLLRQEGTFFNTDVITANTWVPHSRGTFVQISGSDVPNFPHQAALAENHPLYAGKRPYGAEGPHTHTVYTTAVTGKEYIAESIVMPGRSTDKWSAQQDGAIRHRTTSTVIDTREISYRLPHDTSEIIDTMAINEMEAAMAPEPDLSDGSLDIIYNTSPAQLLHERQQATAGQLDPATSLEWASRIR
jgi:hypothetical protein